MEMRAEMMTTLNFELRDSGLNKGPSPSMQAEEEGFL